MRKNHQLFVNSDRILDLIFDDQLNRWRSKYLELQFGIWNKNPYYILQSTYTVIDYGDIIYYSANIKS